MGHAMCYGAPYQMGHRHFQLYTFAQRRSIISIIQCSLAKSAVQLIIFPSLRVPSVQPVTVPVSLRAVIQRSSSWWLYWLATSEPAIDLGP
jgi:hypothetical protein